MVNKKYVLWFVLVILLAAFSIGLLVKKTLNHEKVKLKESSKVILNAAKLNNDESTSQRNMSVGMNSVSETNKIMYRNRSEDGWSMGNDASLVVDVMNDTQTYLLNYFTSSPKKIEHKVKILIDNNLFNKQVIIAGNQYQEKIILHKGKHIIKLSINETFNPKKLNMSADARDLGVHFELVMNKL